MSVATAAHLDAWRAHDARRVTLCKIVLSTPSALTLRYATAEVHTPDGSIWEAGLTCEPTRHAISYLGSGVA